MNKASYVLNQERRYIVISPSHCLLSYVALIFTLRALFDNEVPIENINNLQRLDCHSIDDHSNINIPQFIKAKVHYL